MKIVVNGVIKLRSLLLVFNDSVSLRSVSWRVVLWVAQSMSGIVNICITIR